LAAHPKFVVMRPLERFFTQNIKIKGYSTIATIDGELWEIDGNLSRSELVPASGTDGPRRAFRLPKLGGS
jgi:hypothetical protein